MNEANLTQVTGPTVLAIVQESIECNKKEDEIEKMRKAICKDSQYIVTLTEVLRSQAFHSESLSYMMEAFYLVIFGWLVKAFRLFEANNLAKEIEQVQTLTFIVLGNPQLVGRLWLDIDSSGSIHKVKDSLEMFSRCLREPT